MKHNIIYILMVLLLIGCQEEFKVKDCVTRRDLTDGVIYKIIEMSEERFLVVNMSTFTHEQPEEPRSSKYTITLCPDTPEYEALHTVKDF